MAAVTVTLQMTVDEIAAAELALGGGTLKADLEAECQRRFENLLTQAYQSNAPATTADKVAVLKARGKI